MKIIGYEKFGPATEVLQVREIELQKPETREVIVKLRYSGVNPSDAKARAGNRPGIFKPEYSLVIPHSDGSGVIGRVAYEMTSGVTAGVNISYDEAFDTRVSADLKVRFGGASTTTQRKDVQQLPVINALTSTPSNRDVRIHDKCSGGCCQLTPFTPFVCT